VWSTLRNIIHDNVSYNSQVWYLARTELKRNVHGTWLSYFWLIAQPLVYLCTFWFTLEIGLRVGKNLADGVPYVVWLATGLFPWLYMSSMISAGSNVYKKYGYLVTKLRFPLSVISSFFSLSQVIVFTLTLVILFITMILLRVPFTVYLLQVPVLIVVMHVTFTVWSMMTSPLSAISKDFHNLVKVMTMPLMWVSGVIFDVSQIHIGWIRNVLAFNPITFFVTSFRASICDRYWIWEQPKSLFPFLGVFLVMLLLALGSQTRLKKEVPDVL